ncbi:MAG: nuclear transport factor 2 family protein [Caldilineaceae bacterium]|nr:nuclear transport factor 2 family protein [Caldilineaceae bacterium]
MTSENRTLLERFNEAFNQHDIEAIMAMMTQDCLFDNTFPAPDGTRFQGQIAVRQFWLEFFQGSPQAAFETEELFFSEDRAVQRWVYRWEDADGVAGHVRGVDLFRFREGKIAEKLSYVKG